MTPQHYTQTLEPASRLPKEDQPAFWKGQIIKYFSRAGLKEGVPFEADFAKGLHCVERYKQCIGEQEVQAPAPKYRNLGPHKIPEGCRPLEDHEIVQDGDWFNSEKTPDFPWHKVYGSGGYHAGKYIGVIFARSIQDKPEAEPKYRDLGPHTIPDGYRQLADDEVVQKGDLISDVAFKSAPWSFVVKTIGKIVKDTHVGFVFARPIEPEAKPDHPEQTLNTEVNPAEPAHISKPIPSDKPLGIKGRIPDGYIRLEDGRIVPENDLDHEGIDHMMGHHHIPMLAIWF